MSILRLVLKNITGRRARFIFTLLGITIGVASLVALITISRSLTGEMNRRAGDIGANLLVTPKGWCAYEEVEVLTGEQLPEAVPQAEVDKVMAIKGLTAVPYLTEKTAIDNNPVAVVGILPREMKSFKGWAVAGGRYFSSNDESAVVLGSGIAQQFGLGAGSELTIRGQTLPVIGVLKTIGGSDDTSIFLTLTLAQKLYAAGDNVSFIAVKVDDITRVNSYVTQIEEATNLAVVSDQQLLKSVLSLVNTVGTTLQLIAGVAVAAAAFGIINTMMTAVRERRRDIGILETIGAKRSVIFRIFLFEAIAYGILGGILGLGIGTLFSYLASPYIAQNEFTALFADAGSHISISAMLCLELIAFSTLVATLSGLYPAWQASRLTPVEAIRYE